MKTFTVAASREELAENLGTEIMASSFEEAVDKAEALEVPCRQDPGYDGFGFYFVTDGDMTLKMGCEYPVETVIEGGDDE